MFKKKDSDKVEEEILSIVEEGHEQGLIEEEEVEMITNILGLDDRVAREIMTSRNKIYAVSIDSIVGEIIEECLETGYSRYPVYNEDIDSIVGVLHLKDMTMQYLKDPGGKVSDIMEDAMFVHPTYDISKLLKKMQNEKQHMAIVLDEYGQTEGIATLEDIIEEIVGNIWDEHDTEVEEVSASDDDSYMVDGMMKLHDLEELIDDIEFPDIDIETVNGFILYQHGHFPKDDETISVEYSGYLFEPTDIEDKLIKKVRVSKIKDS